MKYLLLTLILSPLFGQAQDDDFFLDQEYPVATNGTIELSCSDAEVRIVASDRETAHVIVNRKVSTKGFVKGKRTFDVRVSESNGNLTIEEQQSGNVSVSFGYFNEDYTIDIEAPVGVSLQVRGDDGNITIQRVSGAISLQNDDGDLVLENCSGTAFDLEVDDGDIQMDRGQGNLTVHIDDGDITVQEGEFSSVDITADDGDIMLATSLSNEGKYRLAANDGEVDFRIIQGGGTIEIRHDDTELDTSGPFTLVRSDDDYTELSLPDGGAQVDLRVDDGHVDLSAL